MRKSEFKIISVFSTPERIFDGEDRRGFFSLDAEKMNCNSVEAFAKAVGADLNFLCFRDRMIPNNRNIITIPIGAKSDSSELMLLDDRSKNTTDRFPYTEPQNNSFDGIITDLMLHWHENERPLASDELLPHGLGIVAWAVMHGIPVGLVYNQSEYRNYDFWIDSVLDTLQSHPCCKEKIIASHMNDVCHDMFRLLKDLQN